MKSHLGTAYLLEMREAKAAYQRGQYESAFAGFERAHILGQRHIARHWLSHWWMLKIGFIRSDVREVVGQVLRLFAVFPGFFIGWVPTGNTGGANVSPLKPMRIPADLAAVLEEQNIVREVFIRGAVVLFIVLLTGSAWIS